MINVPNNLCIYDCRSDVYGDMLPDDMPIARQPGCSCDRCFYGRDPLAVEIERLRAALRECDEALFHIRATYGGRYGVAWDRAIDKARAALSGKGE